jgi:hypothetical protein
MTTIAVREIVKSISSGNFTKLQEDTAKALSEKALNVLEEQKQKIAKSYFGKK